jgi:hypothetical protein
MFPIWLVYLVILTATTVQFVDNAVYFSNVPVQRDKYQIDYALKSASDASILQLQEKSQLTPSGNVYVDPEFIWKTYKYTFLRSLNIYSQGNMDNLEVSFPATVVAVNDGYYMRMLVDEQTTNGTEKKYRVTQNIPYARTTQVATLATDGNNNLPLDGVLGDEKIIPAGTIVSDTMDGSNIIAYKEGLTASNGSSRQYQIYQTDGNKLKPALGSAHDVVDINKMLLEAVDYSMFYNGGKNKNGATLAVPDQLSGQLLSPTVNFVGPTIFALSDSFSLKGRTFFNYFSVGASQIVQARNYYCYTRAGVKYYSTLNPELNSGAGYAAVEQIYRMAQEAAIHGYQPDPVYY